MTKFWPLLPALACALLAAVVHSQNRTAEQVYLNPVDAAACGDCGRAFVALAGPQSIAVVNVKDQTVVATWPLPGEPTGLALRHGSQPHLAATMGETDGEVALIDCSSGRVVQQFEAGFSPCSPVFAGDVLAVCNRFTNSVGLYQISDGKKLADVPVTREPIAAVATMDGKRLFVASHLPAQAATADRVATCVEVIDIASRGVTQRLDLPNGSTGLMDMAISPDGSTIFTAHIIGHYQVPTNQLERGWMNANALTIIDTATTKRLATVLLDDITLGAANPWGVDVTDDGEYIVVAHHGTHEISRIPYDKLMEIAKAGKVTASDPTITYTPSLEYDLKTMQAAGRARIALPGEGPRSVVTVGSTALVCEYFSGSIAAVDLDEPYARAIKPRQISLGEQPEMDIIRRGELRFSDARLCFQQWQSCVSCHPGSRADALNWDLLNDGIGNPKQTKTMLRAHETPPAMALGVREKAEVAVRAGIRFIQFAQVDEADAQAIDAYLKSLQPVPSPYLVDGELSDQAKVGQKLFDQVHCSQCHTGPNHTDGKQYAMPYASSMDEGKQFDTPGLVEIWRTAPYLYDGRAAEMPEALRIHIELTGTLTEEQMQALVEYVMSL